MELLNPLSSASYAAQSVAYTGTAGSTTGWPAGPQAVLVWSDSASYILVGEGVTATTTNGTPLPANTPVPFKVPQGAGGVWRVSAIQVAAGGTVYAKPLNKE